MSAPSPRPLRGEGWGEGQGRIGIVFDLKCSKLLDASPLTRSRRFAPAPTSPRKEQAEVTSYSIPDSSSSACSINSSLTTTMRRGTRKTMVEAQAADNTKIAAVSGSVVAKWPPR